MGKIREIKRRLYKMIYGPLKCALKDGVIMGGNLRLMGGGFWF